MTTTDYNNDGTAIRVHDTKIGQFSLSTEVQRGHFCIDLPNGLGRVSGATLKEAAELANKVILGAKVKLNIQIAKVMPNGKTMAGTITGRHAGNGNTMVTWADGERQQLSSWDTEYGSILGPVEPEDQAEFLDLHAKISQMQKRIEAMKFSLKVDVKKLVNEAYAKLNQGSKS